MLFRYTLLHNRILTLKTQPQPTSKYFFIQSKVKYSVALFMSIFFFLSAQSLKAQDTFLGLTSNGGPDGRGTAFSIKNNGSNFSITHAFADWGKSPNGDLIQGSDGDFYGMTYTGGTYTYGSIFKTTSAGVITILHQLNYTTDGANPYGELTLGNDGNFYGMTSSGGTNGYGTIFKITPSGIFTVLRHLSSADGSNPHGHLVFAPDGNFYGCTYAGGAFGYGTIFKVTATGTLTVLHSLSSATDGANCYGSLVRGSDGLFYGITYGGGANSMGTIFKITDAGTYTVLHNMISADGVHSQSDLIQATDGNFYGLAYAGGTNFGGTIFKITSGGTFTVVRNLSSSTDGQAPYGALVQATDGLLYGMNSGGGATSGGTVFKITTTGTFTLLHSLTSAPDGASPRGSLVQSTDGNLYGMTSTGGNSSFGTVFKISTSGVFTFLNGFNGGVTGNAPFESLVQSFVDNAYYGTTINGGIYNYGTVFKICGGVHTVLHSFNNSVDGGSPLGSLAQDSSNNFYGMTSTGGANGAGTIFKITSSGSFTVLRALLSSTDGVNPEGNLIQGTDGNFYGMTSYNGRIFKITPTGTFTVLHTLVSNTDGSAPLGSLVLASNGIFYGTTSAGGTNSNGTIFKVTSTGIYTVLKQLTSATDGSAAKGNLLQGTDGNLYGMTSAGGANGAGTLFKITTGGTYNVLRNFNLVTDGGNAFGSLIKVVNNLIANAQSITATEDVSKKITLTGSGGSPLIFTVQAKPKHGKVTGGGAAKTYKSNANYSGKDSFTFIVSVGCLSSAPATINITVTPVPDTPVLAPIGNKSVVKNTTLAFTAAATDADKKETLTYSLIGAPSGATIDATTGVFTWTPSTKGSFTFKVRATDNSTLQLYDEEQITVTVTKAPALNAQINNEAIAENKFEAKLFPDPVVNKFSVILNTQVDKINVTITDLKGVVIQSEFKFPVNQKFEIDASTLKAGAYFLHIQTKDGNKTLSFVKM